MVTKKNGVWKKFLCQFAQEHPDFRVQELQSLVSIAHSEVRYEDTSYSNKNPYLIIQLKSETVARQVLSRSLLLRSVYELWGVGGDYNELKASIEATISEELMEPYTRDDYTFRLIGTSFSRKFSAERQKLMFDKVLSFLPFNGKVDLKNPQHEFHILEDYGVHHSATPLEPLRVFFGRLIGHGQRGLIHHYSLKTRHFIGNTSMDPQLSLIMANQAKVTSGDLILDPFAGSGSILVACAHFGGHVMGADINYNTVHGKGYASRAGGKKYRGEDENTCANLKQYGLECRYLDMLVMDAAKSMWTDRELFNAIVTDPPYGIREGSRKVGSKSKQPTVISPEFEDSHFPEVKTYKLSELFIDLLKFAAKFLVVGGRLVFWVPVVRKELARLPEHPCLRTISCSLQPLQNHIGRQLVTMEKCVSWKDYLLKSSDTEHTDGNLENFKLHDDFREKYFNKDETHSGFYN